MTPPMTPTPAVSAKEKAREALGRRPCDCVRCDCGNIGDAQAVAVWDERAAAISATEGEAEPVAVANGCQCGRIIDTREKADVGDDFGCETTDGRWTCSPECWEIATGDASPPSAPAGVKVKPLEWSEPAPPNGKDCFYDHVRAETPFGRFSIEWKSWKAYDSYAVMFNDEFLSAEPDLEGAMAFAFSWLNTRIRSALQPDTQAAAASAPAGDLELASARLRPEPGAREAAAIKLADGYGIVLAMISAGCSDPQRFAKRMLAEYAPEAKRLEITK